MKLIRASLIVFCLSVGPVGTASEPPGSGRESLIFGAQHTDTRPAAGMLGHLSASLQQLANDVSPAVVQIDVTWFGPPEDRDHRSAGVVLRQHGVGAGVILDRDGYIMTNAHVVEGGRRIRVAVSLPDRVPSTGPAAGRYRVLEAKIVGTDRDTDLALLKVDASDLPVLSLNVTRVPQPGELVFAIGSPSGLRNSVTMGVVSSAWRQPDPDNPMVYLQTDAPISPGNSGGPLVDVTGSVIGLNTFVMGPHGGAEGLGFAIPARLVDFVYRSLRKYGRVNHVEIGVEAQTITQALASGLGLAQDWGVVISDVLPGGPAGRAGLLPGDVVLTVDGHTMHGLSRFTAALYEHPPNQVLEITALRGTQTLAVRVPAFLAHERLDGVLALPDPATSHIAPIAVMGLDVDDTLRARLPELRISSGVLVIGHTPGFDSIDVGLRVGDVIHAVNRIPVFSVDELTSAFDGLQRGDAVVLRIERQGKFQFLAFELE
ncbi:MAG: PDZ domain-containing protein [Acidobacteria bacterium]|nr:PDZ domain-containing protein [Acidobacteriota bacterium]